MRLLHRIDDIAVTAQQELANFLVRRTEMACHRGEHLFLVHNVPFSGCGQPEGIMAVFDHNVIQQFQIAILHDSVLG